MKRDFVGLFMMLMTLMLVGMSSQRAAIHLVGDASAKLQETRTPTPTVTPTPGPSPSPNATPTPVPEPEPAPSRTPTPANFSERAYQYGRKSN
jgi:hypothetical protein